MYLCKSDALSIEGDRNEYIHMYIHMYINKYMHRYIYCIHTHIYTYGNARRKWKPTPVFLPGEFHGQRSLTGYSPCCLKSWT